MEGCHWVYNSSPACFAPQSLNLGQQMFPMNDRTLQHSVSRPQPLMPLTFTTQPSAGVEGKEYHRSSSSTHSARVWGATVAHNTALRFPSQQGDILLRNPSRARVPSPGAPKAKRALIDDYFTLDTVPEVTTLKLPLMKTLESLVGREALENQNLTSPLGRWPRVYTETHFQQLYQSSMGSSEEGLNHPLSIRDKIEDLASLDHPMDPEEELLMEAYENWMCLPDSEEERWRDLYEQHLEELKKINATVLPIITQTSKKKEQQARSGCENTVGTLQSRILSQKHPGSSAASTQTPVAKRSSLGNSEDRQVMSQKHQENSSASTASARKKLEHQENSASARNSFKKYEDRQVLPSTQQPPTFTASPTSRTSSTLNCDPISSAANGCNKLPQDSDNSKNASQDSGIFKNVSQDSGIDVLQYFTTDNRLGWLCSQSPKCKRQRGRTARKARLLNSTKAEESRTSDSETAVDVRTKKARTTSHSPRPTGRRFEASGKLFRQALASALICKQKGKAVDDGPQPVMLVSPDSEMSKIHCVSPERDRSFDGEKFRNRRLHGRDCTRERGKARDRRVSPGSTWSRRDRMRSNRISSCDKKILRDSDSPHDLKVPEDDDCLQNHRGSSKPRRLDVKGKISNSSVQDQDHWHDGDTDKRSGDGHISLYKSHKSKKRTRQTQDETLSHDRNYSYGSRSPERVRVRNRKKRSFGKTQDETLSYDRNYSYGSRSPERVRVRDRKKRSFGKNDSRRSGEREHSVDRNTSRGTSRRASGRKRSHDRESSFEWRKSDSWGHSQNGDAESGVKKKSHSRKKSHNGESEFDWRVESFDRQDVSFDSSDESFDWKNGQFDWDAVGERETSQAVDVAQEAWEMYGRKKSLGRGSSDWNRLGNPRKSPDIKASSADMRERSFDRHCSNEQRRPYVTDISSETGENLVGGSYYFKASHNDNKAYGNWNYPRHRINRSHDRTPNTSPDREEEQEPKKKNMRYADSMKEDNFEDACATTNEPHQNSKSDVQRIKSRPENLSQKTTLMEAQRLDSDEMLLTTVTEKPRHELTDYILLSDEEVLSDSSDVIILSDTPVSNFQTDETIAGDSCVSGEALEASVTAASFSQVCNSCFTFVSNSSAGASSKSSDSPTRIGSCKNHRADIGHLDQTDESSIHMKSDFLLEVHDAEESGENVSSGENVQADTRFSEMHRSPEIVSSSSNRALSGSNDKNEMESGEKSVKEADSGINCENALDSTRAILNSECLLEIDDLFTPAFVDALLYVSDTEDYMLSELEDDLLGC